MQNAKGTREIAVGLKFFTPHVFERGAKLKMLLSIDSTCSRFVALDFERDELNAPDLRALNWLSAVNRRYSLQTFFSTFFIYRSPLI